MHSFFVQLHAMLYDYFLKLECERPIGAVACLQKDFKDGITRSGVLSYGARLSDEETIRIERSKITRQCASPPLLF